MVKNLDSEVICSIGNEFSALVQASLGKFESVNDFQNFVRNFVRPILPHGALLAGLGRITFDQLNIELMVPVDYPEKHLEQIKLDTTLQDRPVIAEWLEVRKPMFIDLITAENLLSDLEKWEFEAFGLERIAIHGQIDVSGRMASYFSFSQVPGDDQTYLQLLEAISPHLHSALMKTASARNQKNLVDITEKELEILKWIAVGRTNKEIGLILDKSEMTVKNQVHTLLGKLGAGNRPEAVIRADKFGLLAPRDRSFDLSS